MENLYFFNKTVVTRWLYTSAIILATTVFSYAQSSVLAGKVLDEHGEGLPGVGILIKDTGSGTLTDIDGNFELEGATDKVLIFSFVGYKTLEVATGNQTSLNVQMKLDYQQLEEVVVIGYGEEIRRDITGATAAVDIGDMSKAPVANFDDALAGRVAGLQITSTQGRPGAASDIRIRGTGSMTQSSAPLYVVDGFPIADFDISSMDPSDIEGIEILKGPSAVAIYGARAGNGVIMITTKVGKAGTAEITYNGFYGVQDITKEVEVLTPYDFVDLRYEGDSTAAFNHYGPLEAYRTADGRSIEGINWQKEAFKQSSVLSHVLSVRGGTESTKYNLSASHYESEGLLPKSGFERNYLKLKLDQKVNSKVEVGTNISYTASKVTGTSTSSSTLSPEVKDQGGATSNARFNLLKDIVQSRPTGGIFTSNYDLLTAPDDPDDDTTAPLLNPIVNANTQQREDIKKILLMNGYLTYEIIKDLKLKVSGGIQITNRRRESFDGIETGWARRAGYTRALVNLSEKSNALLSSTLTYNTIIGKKHKISALLGYDYQDIQSKSIRITANSFPEPNLGVNALGAAIEPSFPSSSVDPTNRLISYFGRVSYSFDRKYFFTGTLRADGSSRFGDNEKFGLFPSLAVAWRFSDESFIKNWSILDNGKLRAEWGQVGNNRIPPFVSKGILESTTYGLENALTPGVRPTNLANPDIRWENQEQLNIGLDLGFFGSRLTLVADVYRKTANDLLLNSPLPSNTGFSTAFRNIGRLKNEGLELSMSSVNIDQNDFKWSTTVNFTFPRRKTLALAESDTLYSHSHWFVGNPTVDPYVNDYITVVGQPFGLMYGYLDDGLYEAGDFDENDDPYITTKFNSPEPGFRKYVDVNGDSTINDLDKVVLGDPNPDFYGGMSNNFSYKGFDLNVFFQWSFGNEIYNANRILWTSDLKKNRNFLSEVANRWRTDNTDEENGTATFRSIDDNSQVLTDKYIEDGSYIRLKTISLGYSFPRPVLSKIGAQRLRIYFTAQNLLTWTNYSGYDPEASTQGNGLTSGVDFGAYPRSQTYIGGISLTF